MKTGLPGYRALIVLVVVVAACGSSSPTPPPATAGPTTAGPTSGATPIAPTAAVSTAAVPTTAATGLATPAGGFTPGPVGFRIVHVYAHPDGSSPALDVFARTDGVVQAYPVQAGVALGSVVDYVHPPDGGGVVGMETGGADEPTCITNCSQFVLEATSSGGQGDRRTILVYPESPNFIIGQTPSDLAGTIEFWEDPTPSAVGQFGNALMPADATQGLLFVVGVAVDEARFGLRLALVGTAGCQDNLNQPGGMIGGNQVPAFAIKADGKVTLHGSNDQDCSQAPVGGPFAVTGTAGSRAYLFLYGTLATMKSIAVPID